MFLWQSQGKFLMTFPSLQPKDTTLVLSNAEPPNGASFSGGSVTLILQITVQTPIEGGWQVKTVHCRDDPEQDTLEFSNLQVVLL